MSFMSLKSTAQQKGNVIFMFAFEACNFFVFVISQFVVVYAKIASEPDDEFTIESINALFFSSRRSHPKMTAKSIKFLQPRSQSEVICQYISFISSDFVAQMTWIAQSTCDKKGRRNSDTCYLNNPLITVCAEVRMSEHAMSKTVFHPRSFSRIILIPSNFLRSSKFQANQRN